MRENDGLEDPSLQQTCKKNYNKIIDVMFFRDRVCSLNIILQNKVN